MDIEKLNMKHREHAVKGKQRAKFGRVFHDKMYRQESDSAIILPQISIMDTDYDYQDEPSV